jgi:hypothetical protein
MEDLNVIDMVFLPNQDCSTLGILIKVILRIMKLFDFKLTFQIFQSKNNLITY